jgi:hypothetical protein
MIFFKYLSHTYQGADHTGRRVFNGGGGGGGHTTSTVTQSNIPEYLRPQVETLLGAGMQEYFNTEFNPETGGYDITGTRPYTPYSADPRDYVAEFSPQQQQVFGEAARMQTPGGFQTGSQLAGAGTMGGIQSAGAAYGYGGQGAGYGGQGAMYGGQAAGMGGIYEQMATDPRSMQAYMSPYMQNVVEIQKQQAIEDAQRAQLGANLGAARQGTYGGARQTLAQTQREAGLNKQLSDIQAQGLQSAFDQAQKSQQFGVTTGLQGLQAGISGAQTGIQGAGMGLQGVQAAQAGYGMGIQGGQALGQLATQQQQADLSRLGFQGQMGEQQQQRQQQIINQAVQDYALSQEMPMQRLAGYNALLRGYATPTTTTSQYQAAPNALQSIGALGTAAGGFGTLLGGGKKEGGVIKYAGGGITDVDAIEGMAEDLSIPQIQQSMQNETLPKYVGMPILEQKVNEAERMKMAQAMMGQQGQQQSISDALMAKADQLQGITSIAEPAPVMAAGGGVVAFQAGGIPPTRQEEVEQYLKERTGIMGEDEYLKALKARAEKEPSFSDRLSSGFTQIGLAGSMLRDPGQFGAYAKQAAELQGAQRKSAEERELAFLAAQRAERETKGKAFDVVEGRRQEATKAETERKFKSSEAATERTFKASESAADRESREAQAKEDRKNRLAVASIPGEKERVAKQLQADAAANGQQISMEDALSRATKALTSPPDRYNALSNRLIQARKEFGTASFALQNQLAMAKTDKERTDIRRKLKDLEREVYQGNSISPADLAELQVAGRVPSGAQPTAPKPAAPAPAGIPVTAPDGQIFYFPDKKSADQFKRQIAGQK